MSYFVGSSSVGNPLAFPSYSQQTSQQRAVSSLNSTVDQLQSQFNAPAINASIPHDEDQITGRVDDYMKSEIEVGSIHEDSSNNLRRKRQRDLHSLKEDDAKTIPRKRERVNRPGQRFGAKKRLWVWTWFVQDQNDQNIAVCDYCGKIITRVPSDRGLPKKLVEHLHTHKLTKNLINTSRPLSMEGNGPFMSNLQVSYAAPFTQLSETRGVHNMVSTNSSSQLGLPSLAQLLQQNFSQHTQSLSHAHQSQQQQSLTDTNSIAPELQQNGEKYRQTDAIDRFQRDAQQSESQSRKNASQTHKSVSTAAGQYSGRSALPKFESSSYSGPSFHRHLLKFLADNKLPIRIIKLQSFQQLIYDLRPESLSDLQDLTGLYTSFVEVARAEDLAEVLNHNVGSVAEASVANDLTQEMIKK